MLKKVMSLVVLSVLLVAFTAPTVLSKAPYDKRDRVANKLSENLKQYSFPQVRTKRVAWGDVASPTDDPMAGTTVRRVPLGSAQSPSGTSSPGFSVVESYNDDQVFPGGNRQVDFRNSPSIQFVYSSAKSTGNPGKFGYNVYDPTSGGSWPRGAGVGCEIQAADGEGVWVNMDIAPNGYVVISGADDASGTLDNHFFWQTSQHGCFWGTGSQILASQYNVNFLNTTNWLAQIRIEAQEVGTDTIFHILCVESTPTNLVGDIDGISLNYFRKVGSLASGAWTGPVTLDTMNRSSGSQALSNGSISASRVSSDVLVSYTHHHAEALVNDQRYDVEVYKQVSNDAGLTWNGATNVSNYSRTVASATAFINTHCLIDSENGQHIIWTAGTTVDTVYNDLVYFWGDFSASLYHWSDRVAGPNAGGTIVKAHNADWGIEQNTQVCGFPSPGLSYIGYESIAECNGKLYLSASQYNDFFGNWGVPHLDDCASGFSDRLFAANGEVFITVSSSLDGILWDAARNLTKTYTPDCDSAGFGGVCMNDGRATISRFGMDSSAYGQDLTFPGAELVIPDNGVWTDPYYLHIFYTEDHYPAPGWRDPDTYNEVTLNPLRWMRVPCVDPIPAAQIQTLTNQTLAYPNYVTHTDADTITATVTNDGNVTLNVTSIVGVEVSPVAGWLSVTQSSLTIAAGVTNTATFDIILDGQAINAPGTIVSLDGEVYLLSNAANNDSLSLPIGYVVADTVIGVVFDTISTYDGVSTGDFVRLGVTNTVEYGINGGVDGSINLDFVANGGECNVSIADPNTASYLFSGGPLLVVDRGSDTIINTGMFNSQFTVTEAFRRVQGSATSSHVNGANYDGFFSGTSFNSDTTIAVERSYYAPTGANDSVDFVIMKTQFFSADGNAHSGLVIGEATDWDIPADDGSNNLTGILANHNTVYQQGTDTATVAGCQLNATRFGATQLLGFHSAAELAGDNCAGECTPYGAYSLRNDTLADIDDSLLGAWYWDKTLNHTGLTAEADDNDDLHTIMTYVHNYTLAANETLTVYNVISSVRDGSVADLEANLDAAFQWYNDNLRTGCTTLCGCCVGLTGNVDNDPGDNTDIGDLTKLIDFLFISGVPPVCMEEANTDGDPGGNVDIGDLTKLIDFLFISGTPTAACL